MNDEHMVAIVSFEGALKREMRAIRDKLREVEDKSEFSIRILVGGRIHSGDVKVEYGVSFDNSTYGTPDVKGNELAPCVEELMRRHGWQKAHAPKLLTATAETPDDIPE